MNFEHLKMQMPCNKLQTRLSGRIEKSIRMHRLKLQRRIFLTSPWKVQANIHTHIQERARYIINTCCRVRTTVNNNNCPLCAAQLNSAEEWIDVRYNSRRGEWENERRVIDFSCRRRFISPSRLCVLFLSISSSDGRCFLGVLRVRLCFATSALLTWKTTSAKGGYYTTCNTCWLLSSRSMALCARNVFGQLFSSI